jgi:hypothetical protein
VCVTLHVTLCVTLCVTLRVTYCVTLRVVVRGAVQVKALSEELENPMNVHRWRKLEGSDPATYEMIQKIQTLQKRLIAKVCVSTRCTGGMVGSGVK